MPSVGGRRTATAIRNVIMAALLISPFALLLAFLAFAAIAPSNVEAGIPVYVMMPLNTINNDGTLNNPGDIKSKLQTLKNSGAAGIMVDCWWGIAEGAAPKQYNFSAYSQLFDIVSSVGMKVQAVMSFHK